MRFFKPVVLTFLVLLLPVFMIADDNPFDLQKEFKQIEKAEMGIFPVLKKENTKKTLVSVDVKEVDKKPRLLKPIKIKKQQYSVIYNTKEVVPKRHTRHKVSAWDLSNVVKIDLQKERGLKKQHLEQEYKQAIQEMDEASK